MPIFYRERLSESSNCEIHIKFSNNLYFFFLLSPLTIRFLVLKGEGDSENGYCSLGEHFANEGLIMAIEINKK